MIDVATRAERLIKRVVEAEGLELVHVTYVPNASRPLLRVYVDKPEGVGISDCEKVSRQLSVLLDVEDFIPTHYVLEVSSPGLERPLFQETDYKRFQGKEIRLEAMEKIENRRNFTGFIKDFYNGVLELECSGQTYRIPFKKIKHANLVYRFD